HAVADDLHRALRGVLGFGAGEARAVHLEHHVHAALEVEAEMDGLATEIREFLGAEGGLLSGLRCVELVRRPEDPEAGDRDEDEPQQLPLIGARHRDSSGHNEPPAYPRRRAVPAAPESSGRMRAAVYGRPRGVSTIGPAREGLGTGTGAGWRPAP